MKSKDTPLYCLGSFDEKAGRESFYMERLQVHLKSHEFITKPHKHDFYFALYVENGGGNHNIDFHAYHLKAPCFFFMSPGQVHDWRLEPQTDGYIIFFSSDFYKMRLSDSSLYEFPFFNAVNATAGMEVPKGDAIERMVHEMFSESKKDPVDKSVFRAYLDLLLLKLARDYHPLNNMKAGSIGFKMRKLEQLLEVNFVKEKHPNAYADMMHMSTAHLNDLCKQNLNKTLSSVIHGRVVLEAKRYFAYTDLSVSQVSDRLGFSTASYFTRFFKKNAGITPDQFKESVNCAI